MVLNHKSMVLGNTKRFLILFHKSKNANAAVGFVSFQLAGIKTQRLLKICWSYKTPFSAVLIFFVVCFE